MKPHVGPKVVQDGAVAKHHMNTNEITQTFLKRRFFFIGSLRAVNRHGHPIKRYGVLEEVNNFGKIYSDRTKLYVVRQGTITALALFQLGPWRSRRCGWPYEFQRDRIKIDMDLFSRLIRKIKHVCVSDGFHCEQRRSGVNIRITPSKYKGPAVFLKAGISDVPALHR